MSRALVLLLLFGLIPTASAHDAADIRVVDETNRSPAQRLALAQAAAATMRSHRDDAAARWADALFRGDEARLQCMQGQEAALVSLLAATEEATRDLRPAVLSGQSERAEREARRIRIALDRAQQIHRAGFECSQLVAEPIEPAPRRRITTPPEQDMTAEMDVTPLELMSGVPG